MDRRDFLRTTGAAAAALAARQVGAAPERPNLVIVHTDEHNFRTLGCYRALLPRSQALMWGPLVCETPNIDWLAKHGAVATRFYGTTPVCSPSRSSFVSGRYPQNTPVTTNNIPMDDEVVTFAEILRRKGYATGYAGKWHLDGTGKPQWGPKRQFGFADNRFMFNRGHYKQMEDTPDGPRVKARKGGKPNYSVAGADPKSFTTDWLADKTVEFIQAHKGKPFAYMVSIPDPHGPNSVRPPYDTLYDPAKFKPPATLSVDPKDAPAWGKPQVKGFQGKLMASYYGMVKCIDDNVGKILKALKAAGVLERTIVLFTSDHGDLCFEHGRHNKGVPYEGSARIPFVLYAPGRVKPGTVVTHALGCVDFLPTILALMGVETAGKEEGRDASGLFRGQPPADWQDVAFFRGTCRPGGVNWLAAATSRFKLVLAPNDKPWLFDLEEDPNELVNRIGDAKYRDTLRGLGRAIAAYAKAHRDTYVEHPRIAADLAWCIDATGDYKPPAGIQSAPAPATRRGKKRRGKRQADKA